MRTSEREVHQQAAEEILIRICPIHNKFIFEFISLIPILEFTFGFVQLGFNFTLERLLQSHFNKYLGV